MVRGSAGRYWRESDLGRNEETLAVITSGLPVIILELQTTVGISLLGNLERIKLRLLRIVRTVAYNSIAVSRRLRIPYS